MNPFFIIYLSLLFVFSCGNDSPDLSNYNKSELNEAPKTECNEQSCLSFKISNNNPEKISSAEIQCPNGWYLNSEVMANTELHYHGFDDDLLFCRPILNDSKDTHDSKLKHYIDPCSINDQISDSESSDFSCKAMTSICDGKFDYENMSSKDVVYVTKDQKPSDNHFSSISDAISELPDEGGIILVSQGIYEESISTSKPIEIIGRTG